VVEIEAAMPAGTDLVSQLKAIPGVTDAANIGEGRYQLSASRDVRSDAARAVVNAGGALTQLSVDKPSLDTIYTKFFEQQASNGGARHAA
jgi:ABC-2 type transport system ATP-binding protein